MDPITILMMASASMKFLKEAIPTIRDALSNGEISAADQAKVRAEYESIRQQLGGEFTGPQWEVSGR